MALSHKIVYIEKSSACALKGTICGLMCFFFHEAEVGIWRLISESNAAIISPCDNWTEELGTYFRGCAVRCALVQLVHQVEYISFLCKSASFSL